jgi:hypothetical protein
VENVLNLFIAKRHKQRVAAEGERPEEALWREAVGRYNARMDADLTSQWIEYHSGQARRVKAVMGNLVAHYEAEAERYRNGVR